VTAKLGKVYGMHELATMIGWDRQRLLRHLKRMHAKMAGQLLVNAGTEAMPRWTITLEALRAASPQWFRDDDAIEARLDDLEEARATDAALLVVATNRIATLSSDVSRLRTVTDLLAKNLRAVIGAPSAVPSPG
jgi:hypothetical protein